MPLRPLVLALALLLAPAAGARASTYLPPIRSHRRVRIVMYNQGTDVSRSPFLLARYPRTAAVLRDELASRLFAPVAPEFLAA